MDSWDDWFGQMTLAGVDPRTWDLHQLLAAFETSWRQNSKDETAWKRTYAQLTAEPKAVRDQRRRDEAAGRKTQRTGGMSMGDAEALMASFAASEAMYR